MQREGASNGSDQSGTIQLRLSNTVPSARFDDSSQRLFVRIFGEKDEWNGDTSAQELRDQMNRFRVPCFMLEQDKPIWFLLQQNPGFFQRAGVLQFSNQQRAVPFENFSNQKKVFLAFADKENS